MKLTNVTVKNYRSYVVEPGDKVHKLPVGDGLNLLIGQNNCGKSNLLRAVALALDPRAAKQYDSSADVPKQMAWAHPAVTLSFAVEGTSSVQKTLLKYVGEYEKSVGVKTTYADDGRVDFRVAYTKKGGRDETFLVKGAGVRRGDSDKLKKAIRQLRECVRFIYLPSGESLNKFLRGTLREILHTVLRDHLSSHMESANTRRDQYIAGLAKELLRPLEDHATDELRDVLSEVSRVSIVPSVPVLRETISQSEIRVEDSADTALVNKGTGVRGALLVALLSYIAQNSRRSLIVAVEEPESFLHPAAQRELRNDLARLAERKDLSLLVTTHSPFMLDRSESTTITPIKKLPDGRSVIESQRRGNEPLASATADLFGETLTARVLDQIEPLGDGIRGVLFVEGYTDKLYLEEAARVADRRELLEGLEIRFDEGAYKSSLQALLLRSLVGDSVPLMALFDWDEIGKSARDSLQKKYGWSKNLAITYREYRKLDPTEVPVEAEDMLPPEFIEPFIKKHGESVVVAEKQRFQDGTFHIGLTKEAKDLFPTYMRESLAAKHVGKLLIVLEDVRKRLSL